MKFPLETSISRKFCGTFMMPRMINLFRVMRGFTSHTSKYPNGGEVKYRERQRNLFWRLFHRKVHSFNLTHFVLPSSLRSMMFLPSSRSITFERVEPGIFVIFLMYACVISCSVDWRSSTTWISTRFLTNNLFFTYALRINNLGCMIFMSIYFYIFKDIY